MATAIVMPKAGNSVEECFLSKWNIKVGDTVKKGQVVCYVEAMKTFNAIAAECDGVISQICLTSGSSVSEDDVLMRIK